MDGGAARHTADGEMTGQTNFDAIKGTPADNFGNILTTHTILKAV